MDNKMISFFNKVAVNHGEVFSKVTNTIAYLQTMKHTAEISPIARDVDSVFVQEKWSSKNWKRLYDITHLYACIEKDIKEIAGGNSFVGICLQSMILNDDELDLLHDINNVFGNAYFVTKKCENETCRLFDSRSVKNKLNEIYGSDFSMHVGEFEMAVSKGIGDELLTEREERILAPFVLEGQQQDAEDISTSSHVLKQLVEYRNSKAAKKNYIGLEEIPATIVQVRKTFTKAGKIRTATKNRMNAGIFEDVMFWLVNKDLITPVDVEQAMIGMVAGNMLDGYDEGFLVDDDWNMIDFEEMEP